MIFRQMIQDGIMHLVKVPTEGHRPDILTKPITDPARFELLRNGLLGCVQRHVSQTSSCGRKKRPRKTKTKKQICPLLNARGAMIFSLPPVSKAPCSAFVIGWFGQGGICTQHH